MSPGFRGRPPAPLCCGDRAETVGFYQNRVNRSGTRLRNDETPLLLDVPAFSGAPGKVRKRPASTGFVSPIASATGSARMPLCRTAQCASCSTETRLSSCSRPCWRQPVRTCRRRGMRSRAVAQAANLCRPPPIDGRKNHSLLLDIWERFAMDEGPSPRPRDWQARAGARRRRTRDSRPTLASPTACSSQAL